MMKLRFYFTFFVLFIAKVSFAQVIDVGIVQLSSPLAPHINVNSNLRIKVRNNSSVVITTLKVAWKINGIQQTDAIANVNIPKPTSPNLAPTAVILISNSFVDTIGATVEFRILEVNNSIDQNKLNDSLKVTFESPISGLKIIGSNASNFKTIKDAINSLKYNGIAGDITLKIKSGIYNENIELNGSELYYASNNANIIIETQTGAKDVVINSEPSIRSTINLRSVKNITLKNLEIRNSNPYSGIGVQASKLSKNISIIDCNIIVDSISNSKGYIGLAFAEVDSLSPFNISNFGATKQSSIKNCTVNGGYYGILISGNSAYSDSSIIVEKNKIRNVSYYGIYFNRIMGFKILSNSVNFRISAALPSSGYFVAASKTYGNFQSELSRNYVTGAGRYGIYLSQVIGSNSQSGGSIGITNNMVAGGFFSNSTINNENAKGLNVVDCGYLNIYFNSINMDAPTNTGVLDKTAAFYISNSSSAGIIRVYNNVFANQNSGYAYYSASSSNVNQIAESNNNDLWVPNLDTILTPNNGFAFWNGSNSSSITGLRFDSGMDLQSFSLNPEFYKNNNLHSMSNNLYQKGNSFPITFSNIDFDGELRNGIGAQDVGCDEIYPVGDDYGIVAVSPHIFKSNFNNPWSITFRYNGNVNGSTSIFVKYKIDGVEQLPGEQSIVLPLTGLSPLRRELSVAVPVSNYINRGNNSNSFLLTVYIFAGNINDYYVLNDTLNVWVNIGLDGIYSIDPNASPSSRTFNSIKDALTALKRGISGSVIFELAENTYNEQLSLWNISNSSFGNTVTFRAKSNPFKTKLVFTPTNPENYSTVLFNNSENIIIEYLTIENRGKTFGAAIQLSGNSKNISIQNNIITVDSSINPNQSKIYPIVSTKLGSIYDLPYASNASNLIIRNNIISGGNAGIAMYGTDTFLRDKNLLIEKNVIQGFNTYGLYLENGDATVLGNKLYGYQAMNPIGYGMYLKGMGDRYGALNTFSGNKIVNVSLVGVYLKACSGYKSLTAKKSTFLVSNNFIGGGFKVGNTNSNGIFIENSNLISVFYNTIFMDASRSAIQFLSTSVPKCVNITGTNYNIELINNILYSNSGAMPLQYNVVGTRHSITSSDNNLYYTYIDGSTIPLVLINRIGTGSMSKTFAFYPASMESPIDAFNDFLNDANTKLSPRDKKSLALDVNFIDVPYDLHTLDNNVDAKANPNVGVNNDFDNALRNVLLPDIGADEFVLSTVDVDVNKVETKLLATGVPNQLAVKIINRGKNALLNKQIALKYTISNSLINFNYTAIDTLTLNLINYGDELIYIFKKKVIIPADNFYSICIEKTGSLLSTDTNKTNNSVCAMVQTGIQGDLYVGFNKLNPVPGTDTARYFSTIQSAIDTLNIGVVANTNILLNVYSSPYYERIVIPSILSNEASLITIKPYQKDTLVEIMQPSTLVGNKDTLHFTVQLNNAKYIRLTGLKISNTGTSFGTALHITRNSQNNRIDNCILQVNGISNTTDFAPLVFSSNTKFVYNDSKSFSLSGDNNLICNNVFDGGYTSISLLGKSYTDNILGNVIDSNDFRNYYQFGVYSNFSSIKSISNNIFNPRTTASNSCINIAYYNGSSASGKINGNFFKSTKNSSIKIFKVSARDHNKLIISNNVFLPNYTQIINDSASVLNIRRSYFVGVYNNSFRYNGVANVIGLQTELTGEPYIPTTIEIKNNLIQIDSISAPFRKPTLLTYLSNSNKVDINYNAYFNEYNARFANTLNGIVASLYNWNALFKMDSNSYNTRATYKSTIDLELQNKEQFYNKGIPLVEVLTDINGKNRSPFSSDLGAYTYNDRINDVAISKIFNNRVTVGVNKFVIEVLNVGKNDLSSKSIQVEYSVDSGSTWLGKQQVFLTKLKESYDVQSVEFNTPYILSGVLNAKQVCFRISPTGRLPLDTSLNNEFVCKLMCAGLDRNTFTIGKNGTENFSSIKNAIESLRCGYDSSIVFKLSIGNYIEETIDFSNVDLSYFKSITFTSASNRAEDVVISPASSLQLSQFFLTSSSNIHFKNLTFNSSNKNGFRIIDIYDSVSNIEIYNCKFIMNSAFGRTNNFAIASNPDLNDTYKIVKGITITDCEFIGGNYGIYLKSKDNKAGYSRVKNNKIAGCLNGGIYLEGILIDSICNNAINMQNSSLVSKGIYLKKINVDFNLLFNKVINCNEVGVEVDSCLPTILSIVANNMIIGGTNSNFKSDRLLSIKNTGSFPEFNRSTNGILSIAYNSVLVNNNNSLAASVSFVNSNQISLYNNIFANLGTGLAVYYSTNYTDRIRFTDSKSNLLYSKSGKLANWKTVICTSLAQMDLLDTLMPFKVSTSPGLFGSFNPDFVDTKDLHLNNDSLNNKGFGLAYIKEDIDGQVRNTLNPDVGCDEFSYIQDIAIKSFISPQENQVLLGRDIPVEVSFTNYGAPVQQVKIAYLFDGVKMDSATFNFSPSLKKNETIVHAFTKKITTRIPGVHFINAYVYSSLADFNKKNDTLTIEISTIDTADMFISKFISPVNNALITTPTNVVVRVNNKGTMNVGDYVIILKRDDVIIETMNSVPIVNAQYFKDVQLNYVVQPNINKTSNYCAYTILWDDYNKANDTNCILVNTTKVGINNNFNASSIKIFPNTSSSLVFISGLSNNYSTTVSIFSIQGEKLYEEEMVGNGAIDISNYANGVYLFNINGAIFRVVKI